MGQKPQGADYTAAASSNIRERSHLFRNAEFRMHPSITCRGFKELCCLVRGVGIDCRDPSASLASLRVVPFGIDYHMRV